MTELRANILSLEQKEVNALTSSALHLENGVERITERVDGAAKSFLILEKYGQPISPTIHGHIHLVLCKSSLSFCLAAHNLRDSGQTEAIMHNCDLEVMCCCFNCCCIAYSISDLTQQIKYFVVSLLTDK